MIRYVIPSSADRVSAYRGIFSATISLPMAQFLSAGLLFLFILAGCGAVVPRAEEHDDQFLVVAEQQGFTSAPMSTRERSVLREDAFPHQGSVLRSIVLLAENDRVAGVLWTAAPEADLRSLKRFLFSTLSRRTEGFTDDVLRMEDGSSVPFLSFFDPLFHEEKIIIVAAGEFLYEFHVVAGKEEDVWGLMRKIAQNVMLSEVP